MQMVYHFGESEEIVEDHKDDIGDALSDEQMNEVFDRNDYVNEDASPKLKLLWELAKNVAEETYTEADTSMEQLEKNLVSVIGQKSVEMNLLATLASRAPEEIMNYYDKIFKEHGAKVELDSQDIIEAVECVRRSRKIFMALQEAAEFVVNFMKQKFTK